MKTATYARYSSAHQNESSIADQQRNCRTYAEREGWNIVAFVCAARDNLADEGDEDHDDRLHAADGSRQ